MDLRTTKVFAKLKDAWTAFKIIVMVGSGRSGKTYSILQWIILQCLWSKRPLKIGIVRARLTWLKETTLPDFKDIMVGLGLWDESVFNKSEMKYNLNGSIISFLCLDNEAGFQKAHGLKTDIIYFNECAELEYEPVRQLIMRNVGKVIFDLNPNVGIDFWLYDKYIGKRSDVIEIHSTFRDNAYCPEQFITEILLSEPTEINIKNGTADETHWKIYGLGQRALVEGLVFPVFEIVKDLPAELKNCAYGMDFGFSNDFTTLVFKGELDGCLFMDELLYKRGLVNLESKYNEKQASIEAELKKSNINRKFTIWADCAEPKSIQDLTNAGFNIQPVIKGAGSIIDGINVIKRFKLRVTERSMNLIKELRNYKWVVNRDGKPTNKPVDNFNHCIAKGTLITTSKGDIPIEDVKADDYVLTRKGFKKVTESWCSGINMPVSRLKTKFGIYLDATNNHKIYTVEDGFTELSSLKIDGSHNLLISYISKSLDFLKAPILNIEYNIYKTDVYDLNVEDEHEFFANQVLVHNCIDGLRYSVFMTEPNAGFAHIPFKVDSCKLLEKYNKYDITRSSYSDEDEFDDGYRY